MKKPVVAFVCVHNSCRSQMAECVARLNYSDQFTAVSAGTATKDRINPDAVRIVKDRLGVDMEKDQHPKLLDQIPQPDIVVTMGCNVQCPNLPCRHREDWGLDDPSGKEDAAYIMTLEQIENKMADLARRVEQGLLNQ